MLLAAGWRVCAVVLLSLAVISRCDQCIRYEFHETALNPEGNSELLINDCRAKNSKVTDYNAALLQIYGPLMINITFNCCSSLPCRNDLQCPFNFNCNRGKCLVADCNLRDEMEIVEEENTECIIDEDCYFKLPQDKKHWSCLSETSECIHKEKRDCTRKCKRCAFVADHWANFNNTIDVGLYNNESPSTSLINDLLPVRNTSTAPPPANTLLEFNLNSLINEPESDSGANSNELRSEEGFSRLLDSSHDRTNHNANSPPIGSTSSTSTTTSTVAPAVTRSSNRASLSNDSFVNSTTVPNRLLNSGNLTSILEFINSPANGRNVLPSNRSSNANNNHSRLRSSTSRPDSSSGFTSNDLPHNIINELTRSSLEPSSSTTTTTTTSTPSTTTTTTPSSVSSSEESSNEANEANSNEFRLNSTIDDFLFTRTNREDSNSNDNLIAASNRSSSIDSNFINLFSSLFANNSSPTNTSSSAVVNAVTVPLAINSSSSNHFNSLASSSTRTNNVFNSPFNTLFNIPSTPASSTVSSTTTTSSTASPTASPSSPSTSAVLSAASILNRSRSAARSNENNRFARRSSSSLRTTNSGRSLLNNHRLIHLPNNRINSNHLSSSDLSNLLTNNNNHHAGTNGRSRRTSTSTTTTSTTTVKPPINSNNPYYHLASVLGNNNAFNSEIMPGILYADFDISRIQPNSSVLA